MAKDNKPLETKTEKLELKNPNKPDEQKNSTAKTSAVMPSIPNPEKKKEVDHGIKTLKLEKVKFGPKGQKIDQDNKSKAPDTTKPVQVSLKDVKTAQTTSTDKKIEEEKKPKVEEKKNNGTAIAEKGKVE